MTRRLQLRRLPGPVQQVGAGDADEGKGALPSPLVVEDVVQVIGAVEVEGRVRIARRTESARVHEVKLESGVLEIMGDDKRMNVAAKNAT